MSSDRLLHKARRRESVMPSRRRGMRCHVGEKTYVMSSVSSL